MGEGVRDSENVRIPDRERGREREKGRDRESERERERERGGGREGGRHFAEIVRLLHLSCERILYFTEIVIFLFLGMN